MGKRAENVSIIGGADGPTSIFLIGNKGKRKLKERIRGFFYEKKRQRVKKKITANPHTLEELTDYLKREYGARELSKKSRAYQEQRKSMKEALIVRYRPELLGDLAQIRFPREELSGKGDFSGEECKKGRRKSRRMFFPWIFISMRSGIPGAAGCRQGSKPSGNRWAFPGAGIPKGRDS